MKKIAINGFGRIGRLCYRALKNRKDLEVVAINDLTDVDTLAHLLEYDSAQRRFDAKISTEGGKLVVDGNAIHAYNHQDPSQLPWKEHGVDVVLECTGKLLSREESEKHLIAGAGRVILSAPPKDPDIPVYVLGVNDGNLKGSDAIISNASCTTNCLAVILCQLEKAFGLRFASMNTIHAYTQDQRLQDAPHKDLRRARAAAQNIIPTSTGAGRAVELVLPSIKGKLMASSYRVPVISGSLIELLYLPERPTDIARVNDLFAKAAARSLRGILEYSEKPLVSSDIIGNPHSAIFDSLLTESKEAYIRIVAWYDNESGYASRLADLCHKFATIS
ncbi:MAG: type I glyceraldehyde-3-phosphate dehydrogenase [Saprospiraceae bacterium]|jgi:glyceraldehyde 3-phosphate dehydrogenase|nr:type I glyceraldehyde-3-phosphate dehydrogenase [Saprospiraceae bacterium]MBP9210046.1 type I glyceraldehyde-3-phosphate dehydrogenase [Saprospiraceae bacterium]MBV6472893.1 Glyceraldehyde-3-phosphate dehydrogenase [Saprospiraceae bacterium]